MKQTNACKRYIIYIVCLLHVSATIVVILREFFLCISLVPSPYRISTSIWNDSVYSTF